MTAKPKLVEVTDHHELAKLYEQRDDIGTPVVVRMPGSGDQWGVGCFCDADELRAWRASQHTSGAVDG